VSLPQKGKKPTRSFQVISVIAKERMGGSLQAELRHILLIEDDPGVREIVERGFASLGFTISCAPDGKSGLGLVEALNVDLLLLDLILPDMDGLEILEAIRALKPELPVVALTALDDTDSMVGGLDAGADDYITKPFSIEELAARVRARLRRRDEDGDFLRAGPLTLDLSAHRVVLDDQEVPLSARELGLLSTFMQQPGMVLSRDELLSKVWGLDFDPGSNVVDVYVRSLRRKIGSEFIETVRGAGYTFAPPAESPERSEPTDP
jgi:two-component system copper resistance phosphate regulon response regulator CusR